MFYSETEICKIIQDAHLRAFKTDDTPHNAIILSSTDISSLIDYANYNKINSIFYNYVYIEKEDYDPQAFSDLNDNDLLKIAKTDIARYKRQVGEFDFNKPLQLNVYCIYNGFAIMMCFNEKAYNYLVPVCEYIDMLKQNYAEQLCIIREERQKQQINEIENLRNELSSIILSDPQFKTYTNQRMRRTYIREFLNKPENKRFQFAFSLVECNGKLNSLKDFCNISDASAFIDKLYYEQKNKESI